MLLDLRCPHCNRPVRGRATPNREDILILQSVRRADKLITHCQQCHKPISYHEEQPYAHLSNRHGYYRPTKGEMV